MQRIDAHLHVWDPARGDYGWLAGAPSALQRAFSIEEALEVLDESAMQHAVLVQAAPTLAETEYLLAIAARCKRVAGVVGWLPLTGAGDTRRELAMLRGKVGGVALIGVRPMLQDLSEDAYLLRDEVVDSLSALAHEAQPLVFDALVLPKHLRVLRAFMDRAERFKRPLTVVLDHLAKPSVESGSQWRHWRSWVEQLREIARCPHAFCKVSGLPAQASAKTSADSFRPYIEAALECFGAERLIWGSDWPVVTLHSSMQAWQEAVGACLNQLSQCERDGVFGANAQRAYSLRSAQLG